MKAILTIAGFDPSGGAGILADAAVARRHGFHACGVVTAVTAQGDSDPASIRTIAPDDVEAQMVRLLRSMPIGAVKIGMVGSRQNAERIASLLRDSIDVPTVYDPVLRASSGGELFEDFSPDAIENLLKITDLLTPNMEEAGALIGRDVRDVPGMGAAARRIRAMGPQAVLVKGGHLPGSAVDVLFDGVELVQFVADRLPLSPRGTGCALSTAIACLLAEERILPDAVRLAKDELRDRIEQSYELSPDIRYLP
ncbi:MAG: hydroxymethylpyrimidine/phosphomethylpyrimidine kinase [Deltaproteobacteria bacterium]|nr:hydroxymethylpyrimidine/phosphomethylpyrimidine kinase [Deltaproteobacteria bacterium]